MSLFSHTASAILETLDQAMAIAEFKLDGTIMTANRNFLAAVGYSLDEVRGRHHRMFVESSYGDSAEYRNFWAAMNRGEHKLAAFKRFGKGGREVWFDASYNLIMGPDCTPISIIKFATDITRSKAQCTDARCGGELGSCDEHAIDGLIVANSVTWQLTELGRQVDSLLRCISGAD